MFVWAAVLLRERETGVEGETGRRSWSGEKERGHAAFAYRLLLSTIAESGTLYAVSLSVGVMDASACFSRKSGLCVILPMD